MIDGSTTERWSFRESILASLSLPTLFTVSVALFPLLDVVKSPFPGFSLGTVVILVSEFLLIASMKNRETRIDLTSCFILYILCVSLVLFFSGITIYSEDGIITALLRLFKFILIVLPIFLLALYKSIDECLIFKTIRLICIVSSLYVVAQQAFLAIGLVIPNAFTQFATSDLYLSTGFAVSSSFRPSGLFLEPAHMAQYCLPFLLWQAFDPLKSDNRFLFLFIVSFGIVLTGSGMGVFGVVAILLAYCIKGLGKNALLIFAIVALTLVSLFALQTDFIQSVLERLFTANASGGGNAFEARIGNGMDIYYTKDIAEQLFGSGFGNVPASYTSGFEYVLNTLGIVGVVLLAGASIFVIARSETWGKLLILLYIVLMIGAQVFTAATFTFYYLLAYLSMKLLQ